MANSFKYIFVDSKTSWKIGSFHHSLSFSADGKTLAGTTPETNAAARNGKVQFWHADSGAPRGSYDGWSWAQFSPTEPDRILLRGGTYGTVMKQEAVDSTLWKGLGSNGSITGFPGGCYTRDGKRLTVSYASTHLYEWDNGFSSQTPFTYTLSTVSSLIYSPDNLLLIGNSGGQLVIRSYANSATSIAVSGTGSSRVGACAWSVDGKWLATGDDTGDTRLWHASNTATISLAKVIPRVTTSPIISLVFVPDGTALIILGGGYVRVWDLGKFEFLDSRAGLPATAKNIAFDHARKRIALAVDDKIHLYELKLPETQPQVPRQPKGKPPGGVPPELAAFDITDKVEGTEQKPFSGLYFKIYQGVLKVHTPQTGTFQHVVAIKSILPGFDDRSSSQERQSFEASFNKSLITWRALQNDDIAPLLGIVVDSEKYGDFPAIVTSWMMNGLLEEYLRSAQNYNKMDLVRDVGRGVAYLHSQGVVHSDIRATSILVNAFGKACLADPGLLSIFAKSPLVVQEVISPPYRWMAPELLDDPPAETSAATDVYAFTMTSLEIFTGKHPFADVRAALIPGRILQNRRPGRPADVTDALWALWDEGWNQDAGKRPDMKSYVSRLEGMA